MQIIDWYLLATSLFGIIVVLTLTALKLALKNQYQLTPAKLSRLKSFQTYTQQNTNQNISNEAKLPSRPCIAVLSYLFRNFSCLEMCLERKSSNKLPMLLSISSISILCFLNPSIIINAFIGLPITIFYITYNLCNQKQAKPQIMDGQIQDFEYISREVKQQQAKKQNQSINKIKALYISYALLSSGIGLLMCGITFKNYSNTFLLQLLKNAAISCIVDVIAIKSLGLLIISVPFSFSNRALNYIQTERLKKLYEEMLATQKQTALANFAASKLSPRKKHQNSPTKVPKAVPRLGHTNSETEALKNAMQIAKKIKKQRNSSIQSSDMAKTVTRLNQVQNSNYHGLNDQGTLNQLFQQNETINVAKGRQTPVASIMNEDESYNSGIKTKRKDTDLVIVQFKKNQDQQSNSEQQRKQQTIQRRNTTFLHSNLDFQDDINTNNIDSSNQSGFNPNFSSGGNKLNIKKILDQCAENIQQEQRQNQRKKQQSMTLNLQRFDPLRIKDNGEPWDDQCYMQQIDGNSPERRRKVAQVQDSECKIKKKSKHFNGNAKRRVIRFTSGQPYLEYLPNMLSKDPHSKHKKSQPINFKPDLSCLDDPRKTNPQINSKRNKTKKQHKYTFGGDQNEYPKALQVQDI